MKTGFKTGGGGEATGGATGAGGGSWILYCCTTCGARGEKSGIMPLLNIYKEKTN